MIQIVKACEKELREFSDEIKGDLADAVARLHEGLKLSMPLSRPMPSIYFSARSGIYRVVYFIRKQNDIWLIHAFKKKTQTTPVQNIEIARRRIKELL